MKFEKSDIDVDEIHLLIFTKKSKTYPHRQWHWFSLFKLYLELCLEKINK